MKTKVLVFLLWLAATTAAALAGVAILNVEDAYHLTTRAKQTEGVVTDTDAANHRVVHYSYSVNQQTYRYGGFSGDIHRRFEDIKPGDKVPVVYDSVNPQVSTMGDPVDELKSLTHGVIFYLAVSNCRSAVLSCATAQKENLNS
jgi:hypothetical protein